ncbi:hypothetical protein M3197_10910 [Sporosarcina aquimarina]|uniref:hypothetical protein n=1 Tax=Sporosarcina aquimarina TaxID=114975 RepID=UPI00203DB5FA|nr:hypothetical protein [Sporosarcina aquimarina]MCM3757976.1 hypothetical protein [Sporosarcina aquimarina]
MRSVAPITKTKSNTFDMILFAMGIALASVRNGSLFDLVSGWTLWTPISLIAIGLQGYVVEKDCVVEWT